MKKKSLKTQKNKKNIKNGQNIQKSKKKKSKKKSKKVTFEKCYPLSFPILRGCNSTRALQSTRFII